MATVDIFSNRLLELRNARNKKRQEVADDIGISRASLEYYEKGQRKPDIEVLTLLAKYYDVSTDYLLGLSNAKTTDRDIKFICEYTGLSEKSVNILHYFYPYEIIVPTINMLLNSENNKFAVAMWISNPESELETVDEIEKLDIITIIESYVNSYYSRDEDKLFTMYDTGRFDTDDPDFIDDEVTTVRHSEIVEKVLLDKLIDKLKRLKTLHLSEEVVRDKILNKRFNRNTIRLEILEEDRKFSLIKKDGENNGNNTQEEE